MSETLQQARYATRRRAVHVLVLAEGLVAKRTVKLAPEPPGDRHGTCHPSAGVVRSDLPPLTFRAVGDSTIAGCGVDDQSEAILPTMAQRVADHTGRDVEWNTEAQLGATMRRVRHKFLPRLEPCDLLMVSAGSNDVMAGRTLADWTEDFGAVLDRACELSPRVVAVSAGPLSRTPSLGRALRADLGRRVEAQSRATVALCRARAVAFADVASGELVDGYWATDDFHPGDIGYRQAADRITAAMLQTFDATTAAAVHDKDEDESK